MRRIEVWRFVFVYEDRVTEQLIPTWTASHPLHALNGAVHDELEHHIGNGDPGPLLTIAVHTAHVLPSALRGKHAPASPTIDEKTDAMEGRR